MLKKKLQNLNESYDFKFRLLMFVITCCCENIENLIDTSGVNCILYTFIFEHF